MPVPVKAPRSATCWWSSDVPGHGRANAPRKGEEVGRHHQPAVLAVELVARGPVRGLGPPGARGPGYDRCACVLQHPLEVGQVVDLGVIPPVGLAFEQPCFALVMKGRDACASDLGKSSSLNLILVSAVSLRALPGAGDPLRLVIAERGAGVLERPNIGYVQPRGRLGLFPQPLLHLLLRRIMVQPPFPFQGALRVFV